MTDRARSERGGAFAAGPATFGALVFLGTATLALSVLWLVRAGERGGPGSGDPPQTGGAGGQRGLTAEELRNIEIFRRVSPSVVNVNSSGVEYPILTRPRADEAPGPGTGSGLIWGERGYIVTNMHVVDRRGGATVTLADGSTYKSLWVGYKPELDLAVLAIQAPREKLVPIEIGRSADLQVGQQVYAIGNPFGLDLTLTLGVVSGLERRIQGYHGEEIAGVIQTDAAINPGNSGGPLLDSAGRLIGLNTALHSLSSTSAGVGFAVPVDAVVGAIPQILESGFEPWFELGLVLAPDEWNRNFLQYLPEEARKGVAVVEVLADSPASRAGIVPVVGSSYVLGIGDIVIGIDGRPVEGRAVISEVLGAKRPGDGVELELIHSRQRVHLRLVFEEVR